MQEAVAVTWIWIWDSSPNPASLPETVRVFPDVDLVVALAMKCGLPAVVTATVSASMASTAPTIPTFRAIGMISFYRPRRLVIRPREVHGPVALRDRLDPGRE